MRVVAVVVLLAALTACGGGGAEPDASATSPAPTSAAPTSTVAPPAAGPTIPAGRPAPESLSRFRCQANAQGEWTASGYVTNPAKVPVSFQVTVHVGDVTGGETRARTLRVARVPAGASLPFTVRQVPAPPAGGPCHVQVLAITGA